MKKVLVAGTFDILHPGHIHFLKAAKKLGDSLLVIVARDQNVLKHKGQLPLFDELKRVEQLKQLKLIDRVVLGDLHNPYKVIAAERPAVVALGYDQQFFVKGLYEFKNHQPFSFDIKRLEPFKENIFKSRQLRELVSDPAAGFLLLNKPTGLTSHDLVAKLRTKLAIKKIGHTGTLDPLATGLLICSINQATKLSDYFHLVPKTYQATIKFGETSDTFDRLGEIRKRIDRIDLIKAQLIEALPDFLGPQEQLAPLFSAKKVQGQKLYNLARTKKTIERPKQLIKIYQLKLVDWQAPFLKLEIVCSAGTYIRSLADDLGEKLGLGGLLWELQRMAIGDWSIDQACELDDPALNQESWPQILIDPLTALSRINRIFAELD